MKAFHFLILALIFTYIKEINSHKCGADKINITPKPLTKISKKERNLAKSDTYTPISIGYDFSTFIKPDIIKESAFSELKSILKETREEFSKLLQIIHQEIDLTAENTI